MPNLNLHSLRELQLFFKMEAANLADLYVLMSESGEALCGG